MNKLTAGVAGFTLGAVAVIAYERWPGRTSFQAKVLPEGSPLVFARPYHLGLALTLVGQPLVQGVGTSIIASEFFMEDPFGAGKSESATRENVALASLLIGLLTVKLGSARV